MREVQQRVAMLRAEFDQWEALLAGAGEAALTERRLPGEMSVKDVVGHLHAWQQVSLARLEAARAGDEPVMPPWAAGDDPEADEATDRLNARIFAAYRDRPWPEVYGAWRAGFLRLLELGAELREPEALEAGRYPWLHGYPLLAVLDGSYEHHHHDHLAEVRAWLGAPAP